MKKIILTGFEFINSKILHFDLTSNNNWDVIYRQNLRDNNLRLGLEKLRNHQKLWSNNNGFEFKYLPDDFISSLKEFYAQFNVNNIRPDGYCDLARLFWIKDYLNKNYDVVVWIDADMILFEDFIINDFVTETLFPTIASGFVITNYDNNFNDIKPIKVLSNGIMIFSQKSKYFIDYMLNHFKEFYKHKSVLDRCDYGQNSFHFMKKNSIDFPVINGVGTLGLKMADHIIKDINYLNRLIEIYNNLYLKENSKFVAINMSIFHSGHVLSDIFDKFIKIGKIKFQPVIKFRPL